MRLLIQSVLLAGAIFGSVFVSSAHAAEPYTLNYRGKVHLTTDTTTDQNGAPFKITGLSGVTYVGGNRFIAVMDNSNHLVFLEVTFKDDGSIATHTVTGGHTVPTSRDYEGIAYTNPQRNSVFISNEATPPPPALYEYSLDKKAELLQTVKMPPVFMGQVDNRGLESLTRREDGREMWTANEEALTADGPTSTKSNGTMVRLQRFTVDGNTVTPAQEYAYQVEPIHEALVGQPYCSGLSDMVVLPDGTLLTLERSAVEGLPPFKTRIYQVDFTGATDVSQGEFASGLLGKTYTPVRKTQLYASSAIAENFEGLCYGPKLAGGNHVLLGVVDDGDPISKNTLLAFELVPPTERSAILIPAAIGGGALLLILVIRQLIVGRKTVPVVDDR
jgi:hypothetical protein